MKFRWLALVLVVALLMSGSVRTAAHSDGPHLRLVHLAPFIGIVDVAFNEVVIPALNFRDVTDYKAVAGTTITVLIVPTGEQPDKAIIKEMLTFKEGDTGYYTIVAVGSLADDTFALMLLPADGKLQEETMTAPTEKGKATVGAFEFSEIFARPTATSEAHGHGGTANGKVSAAYMTIKNTSNKPDRLIKVESAAAGKIETHETKIVNEVAQMNHIPEGFEIPSGGTLELKPGGKHLMLMLLTQDLIAGQTITLTLTFQSGAVVTLDVPILPL
jgi:copper(I)-binding protein